MQKSKAANNQEERENHILNQVFSPIVLLMEHYSLVKQLLMHQTINSGVQKTNKRSHVTLRRTWRYRNGDSRLRMDKDLVTVSVGRRVMIKVSMIELIAVIFK